MENQFQGVHPFANTTVAPLPSQKPLAPASMAAKSKMIAPAINLPPLQTAVPFPPSDPMEEDEDVNLLYVFD
jgi:hypothetical protein